MEITRKNNSDNDPGRGQREERGYGRGVNRGGNRGRNKGGAFGVGGYCICAKCGTKVEHQQGVKCTTVKCPECGHVMVREELLNSKKK